MGAMGRKTALIGAGFVLIYTALMSSADAITKLLSGGYAAPQLYVISGIIVVALSVGADRIKAKPSGKMPTTSVHGLATTCKKAMAVRSMMTVVAATSFFYAFALLPFAEVFIFIGMVPIFAGLLSGPILGETLRTPAWAALAAGFIGVIFLFPGGVSTITFGHGIALLASFSGTLSMVIARYIGRFESNALAQVFYPNLALVLVMALALPFVYTPMPLADIAWAAAYAVLLFGARWLLVIALRLLPAYAVTPLMNLQFVWMVILGAVFFGEIPAANIYLGVVIVMGSGLYLVYEQFAPQKPVHPVFFTRRVKPSTP
ncbi:MAG: DMT family transporter [Rhodobacterales bacterium]|nr:DMT family transporter [Rhodobacterales bacterium]